MATAALTPTERADRAEGKLARQRAEKKAMKLRLYEGGTFAAASFGIGGLEARFPQLAAFGPGQRLNLSMLATVGGVAMLIFTKGMSQEVGSGLMYAGAGPLLHGLGARIIGGG
jgi:hypothetical protein